MPRHLCFEKRDRRDARAGLPAHRAFVETLTSRRWFWIASWKGSKRLVGRPLARPPVLRHVEDFDHTDPGGLILPAQNGGIGARQKRRHEDRGLNGVRRR